MLGRVHARNDPRSTWTACSETDLSVNTGGEREGESADDNCAARNVVAWGYPGAGSQDRDPLPPPTRCRLPTTSEGMEASRRGIRRRGRTPRSLCWLCRRGWWSPSVAATRPELPP